MKKWYSAPLFWWLTLWRAMPHRVCEQHGTALLTVLPQMNPSHQCFTLGSECTLWNLPGFQGRYKLKKKNQYLYVSYSLNFLLKLGKERAVQVKLSELGVPPMSQAQVSFWGSHRHLLKLRRVSVVRNVSSSYFSHLFTSLPYRKKIPSLTQCFACMSKNKGCYSWRMTLFLYSQA